MVTTIHSETHLGNVSNTMRHMPWIQHYIVTRVMTVIMIMRHIIVMRCATALFLYHRTLSHNRTYRLQTMQSMKHGYIPPMCKAIEYTDRLSTVRVHLGLSIPKVPSCARYNDGHRYDRSLR